MAFWDKISSRGNVEDRRSFGPAAGGLGIGGLLLVMAFTYLGGGNLSDVLPSILNTVQSSQPTQNTAQFDGADSYEVFTSTVLGSTNDTWTAQFASRNRTYHPPKLVLFRGSTDSACGGATSDVGPHYCPLDKTIYLDETFFDELTSRFGAKGGDVAQAYVMAHEVGHHVQNELGILDQVNRDGSSAASIKSELQADCYAGLWANSIKDQGVLEPGEIVEALDAAAAVGDDRIQSKVTGRITPETWTHGSSADRTKWFNIGYTAGTIEACNTFQ